MKRTILIALLAVGLLVLLIGGLVHLFQLRFAAGDVYPPYSSLRADPVGTKAFHDSLDGLGGLSVDRNARPLARLEERSPFTLLYLGMDPSEAGRLDRATAVAMEELLERGARVVITLPPIGTRLDHAIARERAASTAPPASPPPTTPMDGNGASDETQPPGEQDAGAPGVGVRRPVEESRGFPEGEEFVSVERRWDFRVEFEALPLDGDRKVRPVRVSREAELDLPGELTWHSGLVFAPRDEDRWRVIYSREGRPVVMERDVGKGVLVVVSDSYLLSNEAMRIDREPVWLAWVAGGHPVVMFDELHHGVRESRGVMALARRYGLHGFFAGALLLAGLFIWRNAIRFPPAVEGFDETSEGWVEGRDAVSGLVNLLRHNVPAETLPAVCLEEWMQTGAARTGRHAGKVAHLVAAVEEGRKDGRRDANPVDTYRRLQRLVEERERGANT
ncbi:MAG TPA: DUF4350 domain-containing protein [Methylomirabilota bacterium]|nr:DUF4350 domain-containing protein [Methylomirabilota bacterium]